MAVELVVLAEGDVHDAVQLVMRIGYSPFFIGLAVLDLIGAAVLWTLVREPRPDTIAAAA